MECFESRYQLIHRLLCVSVRMGWSLLWSLFRLFDLHLKMKIYRKWRRKIVHLYYHNITANLTFCMFRRFGMSQVLNCLSNTTLYEALFLLFFMQDNQLFGDQCNTPDRQLHLHMQRHQQSHEEGRRCSFCSQKGGPCGV